MPPLPIRGEGGKTVFRAHRAGIEETREAAVMMGQTRGGVANREVEETREAAVVMGAARGGVRGRPCTPRMRSSIVKWKGRCVFFVAFREIRERQTQQCVCQWH
jgi:hypothetical protein